MEQQLGDVPGQTSLFQRGADIYAQMYSTMASDGYRSSEAMQAAGSFGGLVKRWRAGLLQAITQDVIKKTEMDTGRLRIRALQMDIFGHAQASKDLKHYAINRRNGGGRAAPMPDIPETLKISARTFYAKHEDDLKLAVQSALARSA